MNRGKEIINNTAMLMVGKVCTQFISFLLLPLYTMLLSTEEYGVVDLFMTYIALLLPLISWQMDQGVFRFMLDYRGDVEKIRILFSSIATVSIIQSVSVSLIYFIVITPFIKSEYSIYLLVGVILNTFSSMLMQFSRGLGKMILYSVGGFITAASTVILNVIFIVFFRMGAHGLFLATMCGMAINCIYLTITLRTWYYYRIMLFDKSLIKEVLRYSLPFVPNQLSGWVLSASDRTIVTGFLSLAETGIYTVASKFSNLVGTFYGFFNTAWVESVSLHYNDEDRDEFISNTIDMVMGFFVSLCGGIIALMPFVFRAMVNEKFEKAYYQIPILLTAVLFQVLVGLYSAVYIAIKQSASIARTTAVGAFINVAVDIILIRHIGLYAASVSTFVAYACTALYRRIDIKKYVNLECKYKPICLNTIIILWVSISYYINNQYLNVCSLILIVAYSLVINRKLLKSVLLEIMEYKKGKNTDD